MDDSLISDFQKLAIFKNDFESEKYFKGCFFLKYYNDYYF